jgi:hypothetical protein
MRIGHEKQLECPRCRMVAVRRPGRQSRCTHCGAELVIARSPSEEWIRAYLYGSDGEGLRIRPLDQPEEVAH